MKNLEQYSNYELTGISLWNEDVWLNFKSKRKYLKEDGRCWRNSVTVYYSQIKELIPEDEDGCSMLVGIYNYWHNFNLLDLVNEIKRINPNKQIDIDKYLWTGSETV